MGEKTQRGESSMSQKALPFKFEEGKKERGITSLGGLALYAVWLTSWVYQNRLGIIFG